ncbi:MAG TPA: hypothetical protein VL475_06470, partial [Planctomycetaceae bacterium]|nr:hypothetical protein [Planctomycetaceae bacterium]
MLTPSETDEWQAPPTGSTAQLRNTDASAFDETHVSDLAALPTARLQPASENRQPSRWLIAAGALGALIACAAVIFVVTDKGTVEIEMADGVEEKIVVTVLRNGQPEKKDWEIRSTDRETRIRSGKIEVTLTGESADRFEIESPDELHVSRGVSKIFTVRRRPDSALPGRGRASESAATAAGKPTNGASPMSPPEGSSEFPDPIPVEVPPPLEEWLKGRTLLTVAKDGSGQFATIQAALQALKPGEAVHILDRGPYRERLDFHPPDDTGLFSKVGTVVELEGWVTGWKDALYGHTIHSPHDFRISGFRFSTPVVPDVSDFCFGLLISQSDGFVLENCFLSRPASWKSLLGISWFLDTPVKPCVVRNCVFECRLGLNSAHGHSQFVLEQNLFQTSDVPYHVSVADAKYDSLVIRHNIFAGRPSIHEVLLQFPNDDASFRVLEITNNTSLSQAIPGFQRVLPAGDVRILNNLRLRPGILMFSDNAEREMPRAIREWHVGHNAYPRRIKTGDLPSLGDEHIFPTPATDVLAQPGFASVDATHPDYFRIPAGSPLATAGAGNKWPAYVGALPPGPAPAGGDWFSKMQQQWLRVAPVPTPAPTPNATPDNRPVILPEPQPLAEWLKGRTVLTVSQDGRGQFSTIQAALNALQRRQVIQVLDRGPYRESLRRGDVPDDTGLISDAKTRLELADWKAYAGHELGTIHGFRLSGFELDAPPRTEWGALTAWGDSPSGLIIEDCHFKP